MTLTQARAGKCLGCQKGGPDGLKRLGVAAIPARSGGAQPADVFRRPDISGFAKAGWTLFVIILPLFGVLIYMITRPRVDTLVA